MNNIFNMFNNMNQNKGQNNFANNYYPNDNNLHNSPNSNDNTTKKMPDISSILSMMNGQNPAESMFSKFGDNPLLKTLMPMMSKNKSTKSTTPKHNIKTLSKLECPYTKVKDYKS